MTLIQAQQKYIDRVNSCHPGHRNRVSRAAHSVLWKWAESKGYNPKAVCNDAVDMADLEYKAED